MAEVIDNDISISSLNFGEKEIIEQLGLKSVIIHDKSFLSEDELVKKIKNVDLILPTERFYSSKPQSIGSARHALIKNVQAKGIGSNLLNISYDHNYSSGGLTYPEAFKALFNELILTKRCKIPPLKTLGIFNYSCEELQKNELCIQYREANTFRLSQCYHPSLSSEETKKIKTCILENFNAASPSEILEIVLDNYIHAFSVGVAQSTPSTNNLTITGHWIDTDSIEICSQNSPLEYLELLIVDQQLLFFNSWIHNLQLQCYNYYYFLTHLFEIKIEFSHIFKNTIEKYLSKLDLNYWFDLLENYPSWRVLNNQGISQEKLIQFKHKNKLSNMNYTEREFHTHSLSGKVLCYKNKQSDQITNSLKYYLAFAPKNGSNMQKAIAEFIKMENIVNDHL